MKAKNNTKKKNNSKINIKELLKNKKIILIAISIIILIIIISLVLILTNKKDNKPTINKYNLPIDNDYEDNKKLYGSWNSVYMEIYKKNKLSTTLKDLNKFNIQIPMYDDILICYIEKEELKCEKKKYSFIDNILYVEENDLYIRPKSEIILKDNYLIIKTINNDEDDYSLLYFEKK